MKEDDKIYCYNCNEMREAKKEGNNYFCSVCGVWLI